MNYITLGRKKNPAVVFLHGWGGSIVSWLGVAKRISGFGFYCILVDFPGFGQTPEPDQSYGVEDYAQEVKKLIDKLNLKSVTLVGHSFGGRVAIVLSAGGLDCVLRLVLVDSAGIKPRRGLLYKIKISRYKRLKARVDSGKLDSLVLEKFGSDDYRALSPVMKESFKKIVNLDLTELTKEIKVPTIIIWGKYDKDTPMYMARKLNRNIKNSSLVTYPAGHYSYLDCFGLFVDDLYCFLMGVYEEERWKV